MTVEEKGVGTLFLFVGFGEKKRFKKEKGTDPNGTYLSVKRAIFRHSSESWNLDPDSVRPKAAANQELDSSFRWNDDEKQGFLALSNCHSVPTPFSLFL